MSFLSDSPYTTDAMVQDLFIEIGKAACADFKLAYRKKARGKKKMGNNWAQTPEAVMHDCWEFFYTLYDKQTADAICIKLTKEANAELKNENRLKGFLRKNDKQRTKTKR